MKRILDVLYEPLLFLFGLFSLPHLILRFRQAAEKRKMLREKFGYVEPMPKGARTIWVHAVSVGEVIASRELIRSFRVVHPDWFVAFSTTTPTGQAVAKKLESERVRVFYFPLDFQKVIRRVLEALEPRCVLVMETEIWPNLIREAVRRRIPIGVINGRISDRALRRYRMLRSWFSDVLGGLSFCCVSDELARERFIELGLPPDRLHVTGNMKFDIEARRNPVESERLRTEWKLGDYLVLVGGSTHEGEEEVLVRAFGKLRGDFPSLKLIIAPRHPERAVKVARICCREGLKVALASGEDREASDVLVLDLMGELSRYYGISDLVFVGGSLISHGGQNPIEAAQERKSILHGPHVSNFRELYRKLDEAKGAVLVSNENELYHEARLFLMDRERRFSFGSQAYEVVHGLRGATQRNLLVLDRWLNKT